MTLPDLAGVFGVGLILVAYAGASTGKVDATKWPALTLNLVGAGLILWSLAFKFNLASVLMEASWALVALIGLIRIALKARR
jgi:hypothetical protein